MKNQFKTLAIVAFFLFSFKVMLGQEQLNDYKYVIVAEQFSCQKSPNDYRLNELTKFLLEKQDFTVFLDSEILPEDVTKNNCLALFADVVQNNNMFKTKLKLIFKDCRNKVVFETGEGVSREKEFKTSFNLALRAAIKTFVDFKHDYNVSNKEVEVIEVKQKSKLEVKEDVVIEKPKEESKKDVKKEVTQVTENKIVTSSLKAELIPGSVFSYKLKNNKSKTVYTILFSGKEDLYMVKGQDALIYKMNNRWVIAEYKEKDLEVRTLDIQF